MYSAIYSSATVRDCDAGWLANKNKLRPRDRGACGAGEELLYREGEGEGEAGP